MLITDNRHTTGMRVGTVESSSKVPSGRPLPPDPSLISNETQFADSLAELMASAGLSLDAVAKKSGFRGEPIAKTTVSYLVRGHNRPTKRTVVGFLSGCGLTQAQQEPWLAKHQEIFPPLDGGHGPARRNADTRPSSVHALAGRLRIRVEGSDASFAGEPEGKVYEVSGSAVTIGRSPDADVPLTGGACASISRIHLVLRTSGRHWTVTDWDTTNRTREQDPDSYEWSLLPADVAIPVEHMMLLRLGNDLRLRFELIPAELTGGVTPRMNTEPGRIHPRDLELVALALLAARREGGSVRQAPSVKELSVSLGRSKTEVRQSLDTLRRRLGIRTLLPRTGTEDVAQALAHAFGYLLGPAAD